LKLISTDPSANFDLSIMSLTLPLTQTQTQTLTLTLTGIELEADINRRWAKLDEKILKSAFDIESARRNALELGEPWADPYPHPNPENTPSPSTSPSPNTRSDLNINPNISTDHFPNPTPNGIEKKSELFSGFTVEKTLFLNLGEVAFLVIRLMLGLFMLIS
jgi:hypothetical protein